MRSSSGSRASRAATADLPVKRWITTKREGQVLSDVDIEALIAGVSDGRIPDYQIAALLMAVLWRGLKPAELECWTRAMIASGDRLSFADVKGRKVDKHSTGGVGDKVTICLAPLVAACGVPTPMLVGRALGHTGGTLDKLAAIPGWNWQLSPALFRRVLSRTGFVIAGQTPRIVPADGRLYALRDATGTVESIPLIASSILSKKIAGGADALVLDVKIGRGAFLPQPRLTRTLARTLVALGKRLGLPTVALLTAMDQPLGREVGNASELAEALEILRGEGPADTRALTVRLGAEMLLMGGAVRDRAAGAQAIESAIASGAGLERLVQGVALQGGDTRVLEHPEKLPRARRQHLVRASSSGFLTRLDARAIGLAATELGAGRARKEDSVDPGVGITLHAKEGDEVKRGGALLTLWYNDGDRLARALPLVQMAYAVKPTRRRPGPGPLIRGFYD
ncbi:MAG TPA: thymidine phosphorylase [Polyangia bacterium]